MTSFVREEIFLGVKLVSLDRYIHRSQVFMYYAIRTAFCRVQQVIFLYDIKAKFNIFPEIKLAGHSFLKRKITLLLQPYLYVLGYNTLPQAVVRFVNGRCQFLRHLEVFLLINEFFFF